MCLVDCLFYVVDVIFEEIFDLICLIFVDIYVEVISDK